jgi:hypothetical protein
VLAVPLGYRLPAGLFLKTKFIPLGLRGWARSTKWLPWRKRRLHKGPILQQILKKVKPVFFDIFLTKAKNLANLRAHLSRIPRTVFTQRYLMLARRLLTQPSDVPTVLSPNDMRTLLEHEGLYETFPVSPVPSEESSKNPTLVFPRPSLSIMELQAHLSNGKLGVKIVTNDFSEWHQWCREKGDEGWSVAEPRKSRIGPEGFSRHPNMTPLDLRDPSWRLPSIREATALMVILARGQHALAGRGEMLSTLVSERALRGELMRVRLHRNVVSFIQINPAHLVDYPQVIRFKREAES